MVSLSCLGDFLEKHLELFPLPLGLRLLHLPSAYLATLKQFSLTSWMSLFMYLAGHDGHYLGTFKNADSKTLLQMIRIRTPCVFGSGTYIFERAWIIQKCCQVWASLPPCFGTSDRTTLGGTFIFQADALRFNLVCSDPSPQQPGPHISYCHSFGQPCRSWEQKFW